MLRLWPPIAVAAMLALGWAVRNGSTAVDDWFHAYRRGPAGYLLFFTDPRVLAIVVLATLVVAVSRPDWRLSIATLVSPLLAMGLVRLMKPLFGRELEGTLAYPSGHAATMGAVIGMVVVVAGATSWAILVATVWVLLGMIGQGVSYHYFTDAVGGVLLGSAIVCVAALTLGRTPHPT